MAGILSVLAALSGTASGYLAGSILHATKNAPSQLLAEALGLSKTASAVILVVPAVLLITYILVVVNRTGSARQEATEFLRNLSNLAFGVSAVLGYFLGAAVADQAGWWGLLGVFVALCLVPAIELSLFMATQNCRLDCCTRAERASEHQRLVHASEPAYRTTRVQVQQA